MHTIAFGGLGEKNNSAMCYLLLHQKDDEYFVFYNKHKKAIQKSVFRDSLSIQKTWKIIADHLRLHHKNVIFLLKNQMDSTQVVFTSIKNVYDHAQSKKSNTYLFCLIKKQCHPGWQHFFHETMHKVIIPYLYKIHIFSPLLMFLLFVDLVYVMFDMYLDSTLRHQSKCFLSDYLEMISILHDTFSNSLESKTCDSLPLSFISQHLRQTIFDELEMHKNMLGIDIAKE